MSPNIISLQGNFDTHSRQSVKSISRWLRGLTVKPDSVRDFKGFKPNLIVEENMSDKKASNQLRVGYDCDGLVCNFIQGVINYGRTMGLQHALPVTWQDHREWQLNDAELQVCERYWDVEDFWFSLPRYEVELPIAPTLYCTARTQEFAKSVTERWLAANKFPKAEVVVVADQKDKLAALFGKVDIFVDDNVETFTQLNDGGVKCFLLTRPTNDRDDLGKYSHLRLATLADLPAALAE